MILRVSAIFFRKHTFFSNLHDRAIGDDVIWRGLFFPHLEDRLPLPMRSYNLQLRRGEVARAVGKGGTPLLPVYSCDPQGRVKYVKGCERPAAFISLS